MCRKVSALRESMLCHCVAGSCFCLLRGCSVKFARLKKMKHALSFRSPSVMWAAHRSSEVDADGGGTGTADAGPGAGVGSGGVRATPGALNATKTWHSNPLKAHREAVAYDPSRVRAAPKGGGSAKGSAGTE